jgi:hypothetical protein
MGRVDHLRIESSFLKEKENPRICSEKKLNWTPRRRRRRRRNHIGVEDKAEMRAADGANALEENYRRWLRSMRDRIESELAGEERAAAEWLKKTLPRLEEDYKRLHRKGVDEMLAPGDPRTRFCARDPQEEEAPRRHRCHARVVRRLHGLRRTHLSSLRYRCHHMSLSEFVHFMSFENAVLALALSVASEAVRHHLSPPPSERPMMKSCPDRSRAGCWILPPSCAAKVSHHLVLYTSV